MEHNELINSVYKNLPRLESKRMILRNVKVTDTADIFKYASDPEVSKYVTWEYHKDIINTEQFVEQWLKSCENGEVRGWAFELKETFTVIGSGGFNWCNATHRSGEIGYVLSREYWNKGLTSEAVRKIIDFGFNNLQLNRIQAKCFFPNIASQKVLLKCGMQYEGTIREQIYIKNEYRTMKMYSILKKEWCDDK